MITLPGDPSKIYIFSSDDDSYGVGDLVIIEGSAIIRIEQLEQGDEDKDEVGSSVYYTNSSEPDNIQQLPYFDFITIAGDRDNIEWFDFQGTKEFQKVRWDRPS